jgi:hypothetical protein
MRNHFQWVNHVNCWHKAGLCYDNMTLGQNIICSRVQSYIKRSPANASAPAGKVTLQVPLKCGPFTFGPHCTGAIKIWTHTTRVQSIDTHLLWVERCRAGQSILRSALLYNDTTSVKPEYVWPNLRSTNNLATLNWKDVLHTSCTFIAYFRVLNISGRI